MKLQTIAPITIDFIIFYVSTFIEIFISCYSFELRPVSIHFNMYGSLLEFIAERFNTIVFL